jgi:hypothetical protein
MGSECMRIEVNLLQEPGVFKVKGDSCSIHGAELTRESTSESTCGSPCLAPSVIIGASVRVHDAHVLTKQKYHGYRMWLMFAFARVRSTCQVKHIT